MGSLNTIPQVIAIGELSSPLSLNYQSLGALFGTTLQQSNPLQIAMVTYALNEQYTQDPADTTLRGVANYLIFLCGRFGLQAQSIIAGGGGGSVIPPPVVSIAPLEFVVSSSSPIVTGGSTLLLDGTGGNPDFRGYNLNFNRNNIPQYQINTGGSYFIWDKVTGLFTCFGAASVDEIFGLYPFV